MEIRSGSMATQCALPMLQSVRGGCGRLVASPSERAIAVALSNEGFVFWWLFTIAEPLCKVTNVSGVA